MAHKLNTNVLISFLTIILVIGGVALAGFFLLKPGPELIQGEAEITEYRVSSKVPGRVLRLLVHEGDFVQVGDTLALLEAPDIDAKYDQAEAAEVAAQAQNQKAQKGTREEQIRGAYQLWQKAEAGVTIAEKSFQRVKNLFEQGVMTAQKMDETTAQRDAAIATARAAKSQYDMAKNGAEREDKLAASALVARAKGAVKEVQSYINETILVAQMAGEVSEVYPELGELVGTGAPIMSIAVMDDMWVTFQVREDLLQSLKVGQKISAFVPALKKEKVNLRVTYMKDMGTFAAWKATKTTGQYDLRTFEVKAVPLQKIDGLRAGMSVILER